MGVSKLRRPTSATQPARLPIQVFRTSDVARILGVSPARVRTVVRTGLCRPTGSGRTWRFGFQDLVRLRAAQGLLAAKIPPRRVRDALRELSAQLPSERPLSGVQVYADGRQVVVRDGRTAWQPDSRQIVFSFAVDDLARAAGVVVPVQRARRREPQGRRPRQPRVTQDPLVWFERALRLESKDDLEGARRAYRTALDLDPDLADAYINLGRLTHQGGDPAEAARLYHLALHAEPDDPVAHYNLAIALEDQERSAEAIAHYEQALTLDPEFADAHFNIARLLSRLGRRTQAMQHLVAYKRLTER
jgi:tetratricopeptide (TPR) repeat protein